MPADNRNRAAFIVKSKKQAGRKTGALFSFVKAPNPPDSDLLGVLDRS